MSFQRYPAYRDSGVEWIGEVPAHWECFSARRLFVSRREPAFSTDEQLTASQKYGVIPQKLFMEREDQKVALALSGTEHFRHVKMNDFVISLRSFQGGIEHSSYSGCVSPAYTVLQPADTVVPACFSYVLKCPPFVSALQSMTDGLRDGKAISFGQFAEIGLPLAPASEQAAIARFLDRETAKIDALIAEQERLIALLQEKRQAVISHAVTEGLDPNVPMKDSGVEWIGAIPSRWQLKRLKHVLDAIDQGWSPQCESDPVDSPADWAVLKVGCVNGGVFRPTENKRLPADLHPDVSLGLLKGDVLISRANTRELVGSAAVVPTNHSNLLLCDKLYRLRVMPEKVDPYFLSFFLGSSAVRSQIELDASGASASMLNISQRLISDLPIALPELNEQQEICDSLSGTLDSLSVLADGAHSAIALLRERRSALITAAVTGQIDVRGLVETAA